MHFARLKTHGYRGEGYYFITFATAPRRALLSEIRDGRIQLFPEGRAVVEAWQRIPADDPAYSLRINVVMPTTFTASWFAKAVPVTRFRRSSNG
ncbi:MAG TPA: hypothetical protein GXZ62_01900 [Lentisphaerae bacterium]|jgi:hypothetical protein|nr:hypothetical protein [Lentisphaerota bacterium]